MVQTRWIDRFALLVTCALAATGCATAVRGTMQRVGVATDPPGAQCALKSPRADATVVIAATPADAEVRRDRAPLGVRCTMEGHLDIAEDYPASGGPQPYGADGPRPHHRQIVMAETLRSLVDREGSAPAGAVEEAEAQRRLISGAKTATAGTYLGLSATWAAGAGAGLVVAPLLVGIVVAAPISLGVDAASGAMYEYPPVVMLVLPPAYFSDESSREFYFAEVNRRLDLAGQALREDTKATCILFCGWRAEQDELFIAEWRGRVGAARSRTQIHAPTATETTPPPPK